jgi:hypothetical protein
MTKTRAREIFLSFFKFRVFFVAFFKFNEGNPDLGIKRMDFQTFFYNLEDAISFSNSNFSDEAGYYQGVLIEEKQECDICFKGKRFWYIEDLESGSIVEMKEPDCYSNMINLI